MAANRSGARSPLAMRGFAGDLGCFLGLGLRAVLVADMVWRSVLWGEVGLCSILDANRRLRQGYQLSHLLSRYPARAWFARTWFLRVFTRFVRHKVIVFIRLRQNAGRGGGKFRVWGPGSGSRARAHAWWS